VKFDRSYKAPYRAQCETFVEKNSVLAGTDETKYFFDLSSSVTFTNLNLPPEQWAVVRTFCLYLFDYPDSLILHLRIVAILSASRRSCHVPRV